jgi:type I restriction enzyme S subunit
MEVRPGYKQTDVGVIPVGWEVLPIGELVSDLRGGAALKPSDFSRVGVKVLPKGGVGRTGWLTIHDEDIQFCTRIYADAHRQNQVDQNYTIVVLRDLVPSGPSIGLIVQIRYPETFVLAQGVYGFKTDRKADSRYLVQVSHTNWYRRLMNQIMVGSTQVHITNTAFKNARLPVPALHEQQAIANALCDVDELLAGLDHLIAKKRDIKQAAMQQLLTGQTRLPGFQGEWETRLLADLADIRSGGTPSTSDTAAWDGDIAWCTPTDITALAGKKYLATTARRITAHGLKQSSAEVIPAGSVVMTSRATIGECAINTIPLTTNQGFKNFVPSTSVDAEFLYYLLTTQKANFISLCGGSTFLEIGKAQLRDFGVRVPTDKAEQTAIATVLSDMDAELTALEARRDKTRALKQGMMQELLTGRTRLV